MSPRLLHWLYGSSAYDLTLNGRVPRSFRRLPSVPEAGDAERGRRILAGTLSHGAWAFDTRHPRWLELGGDPTAIAELHGFGFLADLAAVGDSARPCAQALMTSWIADCERWNEIAWAPDILGSRIAAWLTHARFLEILGNDAIGTRALASLARQARHLSRVVATNKNGVARLRAIKGLIYASACGICSERTMQQALACLRQAISVQVLEGGIHAGRSPDAQYQALAILMDIRAILHEAGIQVPEALTSTIPRAARALECFRHGDGGLALFNGSTEGAADRIDDALKRAKGKRREPPRFGAVSFQRLAAGTTLVIQDTGPPPGPGFDTAAHAGMLSFEMSCGRDRLVVNCGAAAGPTGAALRTTAAHSTLTVQDVNSAEILPAGGLGRRPRHVECAREEMDGNIWITASHDGYEERFGVIHRRRIYLTAAGDNLRGEDGLVASRPGASDRLAYVIRFHLHPDVQASLIHSGAAVLLRLPSGAGWRFQCGGAIPELADSIYIGDGGAGKRTRQIMLAGEATGAATTVKWAFQQITG